MAKDKLNRIKNQFKKSSQPMLTRLTCYSRYEMGITPQKESWTNHKAHSSISQC